MGTIKKTVFFSWQSDTVIKNTKLIRKNLDKALKKVNEIKQCTYIRDEATRDVPGSISISESIFNKIKDADIFVCDLTIINDKCNCEVKKTPNPNVLIELGYAIALLGWSRIIIMFNKECGVVDSDLPFDVKTNRVSTFDYDGLSDFDEHKFQSLLKGAISVIHEKKPLTPLELSEPKEVVERKNDKKQIERLLPYIEFDDMINFLDDYPSTLNLRAFHKFAGLKGEVISSRFRIYDQQLNQMLLTYIDQMDKILFNTGFDWLHIGCSEYKVINKKYQNTPAGRDKYWKLDSETFKTWKMVGKLKDYIRENFIYIDLQHHSKMYFDEYNKTFLKETE